MKHALLLLCSIGIFNCLAQPREQQPESSQQQNKEPLSPQTQELAAYISHLQQTGQLALQEEASKPDKEAKESKEDLEAKKFQDAANGIFAGMLTVISGASAGDPVLIASGIFNMLSTAIAVTTRNRIHDEEQPLPVAKRSRTLNKQIRSRLQIHQGSLKRKV